LKCVRFAYIDKLLKAPSISLADGFRTGWLQPSAVLQINRLTTAARYFSEIRENAEFDGFLGVYYFRWNCQL
jgi:hypothetical protein